MKISLRFLALALSIMLTVLSPLSAFAEEELTDNVQLVGMSSNTNDALPDEEVQAYAKIADELRRQTSDKKSIHRLRSNGDTVVYSSGESKAEDEVVVQEVTYRKNSDSAISVLQYTEVVLRQEKRSSDSTNTIERRENSRKKTAYLRKDTDSPVLSSETRMAGASDEFEGQYIVGDPTGATRPDLNTITIAEMLAVLKEKDQADSALYNAYLEVAKSVGFGSREKEILSNLEIIAADYNSCKDAYEEYQRKYAAYLLELKTNPDAVAPQAVKEPTIPRIEINGVDLSVNKSATEVGLTKADDGRYTLQGNIQGVKTDISIDASAALTIYYDGTAKITRKVYTDNPTDFVIALDVSGSMSGDRYSAMTKALDVLLNEIFAGKGNTVSIVCWDNDASVVQLTANGVTLDRFSAADGVTSEQIIGALQRPGGGTEPDTGLAKAYELLSVLQQNKQGEAEPEERNTGVLLFTDGAANSTYNENQTIINEEKLMQDFGTTVVNVSIGDEYDVNRYRRYLDPSSETYRFGTLGGSYTTDENAAQNRQKLQEKVVYYNIPKLTDQELADKVTELFEVAFVEIVTETTELKTETITDGVLAAVSAKLIDTVPTGFQVVEVQGERVQYKLQGTNADGKTVIEFDLDELKSGQNKKLSYFVVPLDETQGVGVTATQGEDAVLVAEPVDRLQNPAAGSPNVRIVASVNAQGSVEQPEEQPPVEEEEPKLPDWAKLPDWWPDREEYESLYYNEKELDDSGKLTKKQEWQFMVNLANDLHDAGVRDGLIQWTIQELIECPDDNLRELYFTMFSDENVDISVQTNKPNDPSYTDVTNDGSVIIVFNDTNINESVTNVAANTIIHEIGHAIDYYANNLFMKGKKADDALYTTHKDRTKEIFKDVENHVRGNVIYEVVGNFDPKVEWIVVEYITYKIMNENLSSRWQGKIPIVSVPSAEDVYGELLIVADIRTEEDMVNWLGQPKQVLMDVYDRVVDMYRNPSGQIVDANMAWAYSKVISDVYGGVTNNNIVDGSGHWDSRKGQYSNAYDYWYTNTNTFKDMRISELWAEYAAGVVTISEEKTKDLIDEFFPSYDAEELAEEMLDLLYADMLKKGIR